MDTYFNGRAKFKPANNAGTLPQSGDILRLMLANPLGKLETGMHFNIAGMHPFSSDLPGFIRPVLTGY